MGSRKSSKSILGKLKSSSEEKGESWSSRSRSLSEFVELVELGGERGNASRDGGGGRGAPRSLGVVSGPSVCACEIGGCCCAGTSAAEAPPTGGCTCVAVAVVLTRFGSGGFAGTSTGLDRFFRTMTGLVRAVSSAACAVAGGRDAGRGLGVMVR